MVVGPYLGKCDSTDPMTGTSINKWRVHVCVGGIGDYSPRGRQNFVNTPRTRTNSEVT